MIRQFSLLLLRPLVLRGVALAAAAAGVLALCVGLPGLRSGLEESSADPLWRLVVSRPHEQERRVVLVDIDENSLARVGAWPWPRERVAALVDALGRHGARAQVFDIAFPEARPGDAALAAAQARHPLHIGQLFALEPAPGGSECCPALSTVFPVRPACRWPAAMSPTRRRAGRRLAMATTVIKSDMVVSSAAPVSQNYAAATGDICM